eukprot:CAMPEP_0176429122 /NCGR_PEP_ID=MMETSP0127-20121128/13534_1 /TAXON_ID=938130 /ORGANISM="Platyophrya macrostoma, Strain WH" /LENGTH=38 /DNA_ID= /DNA_START= /DNA_END= /DNA_ORIENTATION=
MAMSRSACWVYLLVDDEEVQGPLGDGSDEATILAPSER